MAKYASKVVAKAASWVGLNEYDGSHKKIVDIYNSHKPLPVGYKLKYTDAWCAGTVSAVAIDLGYTDIIPCECSCPRMITLMQKMGIWVENENRTPNPGDIIFYDWDDSGSGDNKGSSDHVGIVEKVSNGKITVIEGNYSNAVKRRTLAVNGRYIRGYGVPKYDAETAPVQKDTIAIKFAELEKGCEGEQVKTIQRLLYAMGYDIGTSLVDGDFGKKTDAAVKLYQKHKGLEADGIVGEKTWNKLLKG
jgi:hypothetical protein